MRPGARPKRVSAPDAPQRVRVWVRGQVDGDLVAGCSLRRADHDQEPVFTVVAVSHSRWASAQILAIFSLVNATLLRQACGS